MDPTTAPASTDPPSFTRILDNTPVTGAKIACVTLSVSISTRGSPTLTASPARLNHRPIDNLTPAFAIWGTRISITIEPLNLMGQIATGATRCGSDPELRSNLGSACFTTEDSETTQLRLDERPLNRAGVACGLGHELRARQFPWARSSVLRNLWGRSSRFSAPDRRNCQDYEDNHLPHRLHIL
jgi:hypothetical protein